MNHAPGIRLPVGSKLAINQKKNNDVTICRYDVIVKFFWHCHVSFVKFSYWSQSVSWVVIELRKFWFVTNWPEIRKSEIPSYEFCPISGDWSELGISNLAGMSLMKSYRMSQNARVKICTISELLRENHKWGKITPHPD